MSHYQPADLIMDKLVHKYGDVRAEYKIHVCRAFIAIQSLMVLCRMYCTGQQLVDLRAIPMETRVWSTSVSLVKTGRNSLTLHVP